MSRRRVLISACSSGLCNRLLVAAGSLRIARRTQREFCLHWPQNSELNCPFPDLFRNPFTVWGDQDMDWLLRTERAVKVYNVQCPTGPTFSAVAENGDPDIDILLLKAWFAPRLASETIDANYFQEIREHLLELIPHPDLKRRADEFPLPPQTLGVHIRRDPECEKFDQSRDEHFTNIMRQVLRLAPDTMFYLATNHPPTKAAMMKEFDGHILALPETAMGREYQDVQEALVELLLLRRTAAIIGTYYSSFSFTASLWGPDLLITADEDSAQRDLETVSRQLVQALAAKAGSIARTS